MFDLSAEQVAAIQSRSIVLRLFIYVEATDSEGNPDPAGFWNDVHTVEHYGKTYYGSGNIIAVESLSAKSDMTIPGLQVQLVGLPSEANNMVRANIKGQEPITYSLGVFDPDTSELIGALIPMFVGFIDDVDIPTPASGGDSVITLTCESTSRSLTIKRYDTRSDETMKRRNPTDGSYQYTNLQRENPVHSYFGRQR